MKKLQKGIYRVLYRLVELVYPSIEVEGLEHLPQEPCVIIANHCKMNGPIALTMYFPGPHYLWCASEMMGLKEVPAYAFQDFWRNKPKYSHWFYRLLSYLIAPLCVCVFNSGPSIAVYRDKRVIHTFRETTEKLRAGANVVIFPEHDAPHNHILCDFQDGFVSVAKDYHRQTGKQLAFVPLYLTPALGKMILGKPVVFDPDAPIKQERRRITEELMDTITQIAVSLPRHRVVPYNNMPKKDYGYNIPPEVTTHEAAGH